MSICFYYVVQRDSLVTNFSNVLNPNAHIFIPYSESTNSVMEIGDPKIKALNESSTEVSDPMRILRSIKEKNVDKPVIAQLNINSIASKFDPLTLIIKDNIDLLMVSETKVDNSFPSEQFRINGYSRPIRLDRTRFGGGIMIFSREDLTCHELNLHNFSQDIECIFLEMRIKQSKWLIVCGYNPEKKKISSFLNEVGNQLDKYLSKFENLLVLGDLNCAVHEEKMKDFCQNYNLENLIKDPTCFKIQKILLLLM